MSNKLVLAIFAACALILCIVVCGRADDRSVLLDIAPLSNYSLIGWLPNNTNSICTWEHVTCDQDGRVTGLDLVSDYDALTQIISGSLPQSIAQLDRLQVLNLGNNPIYGDFPTSLFLLPNIESIWLGNTALKFRLPANISSSIRNIVVSYGNVETPIPDANWDSIVTFGFEGVGVKCPLPPGLVAHFNANKTVSECSFNMNPLFIDKNNMLCGQVHVSQLTCAASLMAYKAPYFATDDTRQLTKFSASLGNFTIEFTEDEAMIFTTYPTRSGKRKEYRREYLSFRLQPAGDLSGPYGGRYRFTTNMPVWDVFVVEENRIRANSTKENSLVHEFVFDYVARQGEPFVKVSNALYNLGHVWAYSPDRLTKVSLNFIFSIRLAHSPAQGDALACSKANAGGSTCSSEAATLNSYFDFGSSSQVLIARTKTVEFQYVYGLIGTLDGAPLFSNSTTINAARIPVPLSSARWLESSRRAGTNVKSNFTEEEQSFCISVEIFAPEFQRKLYFDPDVSITLLFDPNVAPEASDPEVAAASSVGLIVGLVVVGVVVVASLTLFATVVFPYMKRRNALKSSDLEMDQEVPTTSATPDPNTHENRSHRKSTWVRATTPS